MLGTIDLKLGLLCIIEYSDLLAFLIIIIISDWMNLQQEAEFKWLEDGHHYYEFLNHLHSPHLKRIIKMWEFFAFDVEVTKDYHFYK